MHTICFYGGWVFFNVSIQLGMLPSENIVMPIFKKREKYLGTYKPIKLTLTVCKTSEQSQNERVTKDLKLNEKWDKNQQ